MLLGCDYNGHHKLKGIGMVKACKIVRKAFLESSRRNTTETDSASEVSQLHRIVPMSPASNASPRKKRNNKLPALEIVWNEFVTKYVYQRERHHYLSLSLLQSMCI